jgi:hypothetical protein
MAGCSTGSTVRLICASKYLRAREEEGLELVILGGGHLGGGAMPADFALVQQGDLIGDAVHRGHVVGDGEGGGACFRDDVADERVDGAGHDRV